MSRQHTAWSGTPGCALFAPALLATVLLAPALTGCEMPLPPGGIAQEIPFTQVGEPDYWTDDVTGKRLRRTHWRYADGYTTVTIDDITTFHNDVSRGAHDPGPPVRF
jgi:hypothetical protein